MYLIITIQPSLYIYQAKAMLAQTELEKIVKWSGWIEQKIKKITVFPDWVTEKQIRPVNPPAGTVMYQISGCVEWTSYTQIGSYTVEYDGTHTFTWTVQAQETSSTIIWSFILNKNGTQIYSVSGRYQTPISFTSTFTKWDVLTLYGTGRYRICNVKITYW